MRKTFGDRMISRFVLIINYPGRRLLQEFVMVKHLTDQTAAYPEIRNESRCIHGAYFRPPVVVIKIAVKNIVDDLHRIVTFTGKINLQFFQFVLGGHVIEQRYKFWLQVLVDKEVKEFKPVSQDRKSVV